MTKCIPPSILSFLMQLFDLGFVSPLPYHILHSIQCLRFVEFEHPSCNHYVRCTWRAFEKRTMKTNLSVSKWEAKLTCSITDVKSCRKISWTWMSDCSIFRSSKNWSCISRNLFSSSSRLSKYLKNMQRNESVMLKKLLRVGSLLTLPTKSDVLLFATSVSISVSVSCWLAWIRTKLCCEIAHHIVVKWYNSIYQF